MDNGSGFKGFQSWIWALEEEMLEYESSDSATDTGSVSNPMTAKSTGSAGGPLRDISSGG